MAPIEAAREYTGMTHTAEMRQPSIAKPLDPGIPSFVAYAAGKVAALNSTERWVKEDEPHFGIVHLMPSYVLGRVGMATSLSDLRRTANKFILDIVLGTEGQIPDPAHVAMVVNHTDDCARIHVQALDAKVPASQSLIISSGCDPGLQWNQAMDVVKKHFPQAYKAGLLPCSGSIDSVECRLDNTKTQQTFGFRHSYEDAVRDLVQ